MRGRSGRQGDPGSTRFYLALDDDIMRIFGGEQVAKVMTMLKIPEDEPIEHSMVSRSIEQAQIKVEGFNFDARKHVVEYDDVMNKQREIVYGLRKRVLSGEITESEVVTNVQTLLSNVVKSYAPRGIVESEVLPIVTALVEIVPFDDDSQSAISQQFKQSAVAEEIITSINQIIADAVTQRKSQVGEQVWQEIIKYAYLSSIDNLWIDHLDAVDDMREGIGLRGYGQRDPLVEYKAEAYTMFERLMAQIDSEFAKRLFRIQIGQQPVAPVAQAIEIKPDAVKPTSTNNDFLTAMQTLQKTSVENEHKNSAATTPAGVGAKRNTRSVTFQTDTSQS